MFVAGAMCGVECKSSCLVLQLQSADYLERWRPALNEAGQSVLMKRQTHNHESRAQYISLLTAIFTVYSQ